VHHEESLYNTPAKHPPPPPKIPIQTAPCECMAKGQLEDSTDGARWISLSTSFPLKKDKRDIYRAHYGRLGFGLLLTAKVCSFILLPYVALGLNCLVQVLNVQVPLLFKSTVGGLNVNVDIMARFLAGSFVIGCTSSSSSSSHPPHILTRPSSFIRGGSDKTRVDP
jgi:hypothetical protein